MQALRAAPAPPLGGGAMQAEQQVAAQHVAQQQLNAAALATMLSHGQPGQQYAQGALAQLLAFGAGQPVWPPHALAGQQMQLQPPPAQPDAAQARGGDERSGEERGKTTTNYAARHQAAEKRRRNRINDRLAALREITPFPASCNTGQFLEELLSYITTLQSLAGVAPKQPLPLVAAGGAGGAARAAVAPPPAQMVAPLVAAGGEASAGADAASEEEEAAAAAPPKRRRAAARG